MIAMKKENKKTKQADQLHTIYVRLDNLNEDVGRVNDSLRTHASAINDHTQALDTYKKLNDAHMESLYDKVRKVEDYSSLLQNNFLELSVRTNRTQWAFLCVFVTAVGALVVASLW
jgi:DNA repair exonuclease SbcCD ATPase subunit